MLLIVIVICMCYTILQLALKEKIYRPSVLLAFIWGVILTVYSLGLYQLPRVGNDIYLIILSGLLMFFLGTAIARLSRKRVVIGSRNLFSRSINSTIFNILRTIFFVVMLIPAFRSMLLLVGGSSLYTIRYSLQNDVLGTGTIAILFNYFCEPFLTFLIVYSVANLFSSQRRVSNIVSSVIGIILMTVITGGRFFILYFIGALLIAFLLYRKKLAFSNLFTDKKVFRRVRILIVIAIIAIFIVSAIRGSEIGQTIYVYLCGGVPFLEHLNNTLVKEHTYGAATLYGFLRPIFVIFRKVGICGLPRWLQNIEQLFLSVDNAYYLAPGILFNSFSTSFFAPYLDGGILGVCCVYFVFGFFSECIYKRVDIEDEYIVSWFILVSLVVLLSFFRLVITHYSFALAFVYLFLTHKQNRCLQQN